MSTDNAIEVYEGNDLLVVVNVTGISSLSGYTATFTVKENKESANATFTAAGSISALQITFNITEAQNSIDWGHYWYEVTITNGSKIYTLAQDGYKVEESIVYHITGS